MRRGEEGGKERKVGRWEGGWEGGREEGMTEEKKDNKIKHIAQYVQSMLTYHCTKAGGTIHSIA